MLTQNIDGLHKVAGSTNVIEVHGTLQERFCPQCEHPRETMILKGLQNVAREAGLSARKSYYSMNRFNEECSKGFGMVFCYRHQRGVSLHRRTGRSGDAGGHFNHRDQSGHDPVEQSRGLVTFRWVRPIPWR